MCFYTLILNEVGKFRTNYKLLLDDDTKVPHTKFQVYFIPENLHDICDFYPRSLSYPTLCEARAQGGERAGFPS